VCSYLKNKQLLVLWFATSVAIFVITQTAYAISLDTWIQKENAIAKKFLFQNISPPGTTPGVIVASPSTSNPDYYYHWVRDSAIVVKAVLFLYKTSQSPQDRRQYLQDLRNYVNFTQAIQQTAVEDGLGLGEPKFYPDGSLYKKPWGRPQNDGPAMRALGLINFANIMIRQGEKAYVKHFLYDSKTPTNSVIKKDLDYVLNHWKEPSYGPWEEVRGRHFYVDLLSKKALTEGAQLALELGDITSALQYLKQVYLIELELARYWNSEKGYIVATLDQDAGPNYKKSGLDAAVIVAVLAEGYNDGSSYSISDERILSTFTALVNEFQKIYPINNPEGYFPGIAIGRYPEDRYDGYQTNSTGNPWSSLTLSAALFCYRLAQHYQTEQKPILITQINLSFFKRLLKSESLRVGERIMPNDSLFRAILNSLKEDGDRFMARIQAHINEDGSLSEQINRITGFQQGASHLSLNYAAFLLAVGARNSLQMH